MRLCFILAFLLCISFFLSKLNGTNIDDVSDKPNIDKKYTQEYITIQSPYNPPPYPDPGWNLDLSEIPLHLQALTLHTFTLSLTSFPGWVGGNLVITDVRGQPVPWVVQIPTNHTAFITIFVGIADFNINLTVIFPHQKTYIRDFWVTVT